MAKRIPYREELTPAERGQLLVEALRAMPDEDAAGSGPWEVPGDGTFTWDFREVSKQKACGTCGCAMGLADAMGLTRTRDIQKELGRVRG